MPKFALQKHVLPSGTKVSLREVKLSDAKQVLDYARAMFINGEGMIRDIDEFTFTLEQEREHLQNLRKAENNLMIVAEIKGKIVGNIDLHMRRFRREAHVGYIGMGILPEFRGLGIGTVLMEALVKWAKSRPKIEIIYLEVLASNKRAIKLYKNCGFKKCGTRRRAVKIGTGKYADLITMELLLS